MAKNVDISQIQEFYESNMAMIDEELEVTESLYTELKNHFDGIKRSTSNGALTFISKQTPNLIALRKNKIDLIKEKNSITKNVIDSSIKLIVEDENDNKDNEILKQLHQMLLSNNPSTYLESMENDNEEITEEDMDNLLEARLEEINSKKEKTKSKPKEQKLKHKSYNFVIDTDYNLYAVDSDYNILEDEDIEYPDWEITFEEDEHGGIYALNQYNEEIEIVSFEEDD